MKADAPLWAAQNHLDMDDIQFARRSPNERGSPPRRGQAVVGHGRVSAHGHRFRRGDLHHRHFHPAWASPSRLSTSSSCLMAGRFLRRRGVLLVAVGLYRANRSELHHPAWRHLWPIFGQMLRQPRRDRHHHISRFEEPVRRRSSCASRPTCLKPPMTRSWCAT